MVSLRISAPQLLSMSQRLTRLSQSQFDKAVKDGTTRTARKFVEIKKAKIEQDVDRPTAFTKRAYDYDKADANGRARVFVRTKQSEYLSQMEFGATVRARGKRRPYSISDSVKDRYGGLFGSKGIQRRIMSRNTAAENRRQARIAAGKSGALRNGAKHYFVDKIKGKKGVFLRTKRSGGWDLKMLVRFLDSATYRPTLNFRSDANEFGQRFFGRFVNDEVDRILSRRR